MKRLRFDFNVLVTPIIMLLSALLGCHAHSDVASPPIQNGPSVSPLTPPKQGPVTVAVVLSSGAEVVDFAGPWGVFEYANVPSRDEPAFRLFTVADSTASLKCSGGLVVVPDFRFADSPRPNVIVIPAMGEPSDEMIAWIRENAKHADITMSVCTGAFVLAKTGLLDGKSATTHHGSYGYFAGLFPEITVKRGARFVDSGSIATAGGLTSGIDLSLHVVARYFGVDAAERTARDLEYQGVGWKDAQSNAMFAARPISTEDRPICPVCEMQVSKDPSLRAVHHGRTVYFCAEECKRLFVAHPDRFSTP